MKETISQIRLLLSRLEDEASTTEDAAESRAFSGMELPDIICDVVDLLMPELKPYEFAFYLYLLRHSVIESGKPYIRVSRRGLQSGVIRSSLSGSTSGGKSPDSGTISFKTVRQTLEGLTAIGAIKQESEANRDGTLYRVLLPEEIEVCQHRHAEMSESASISATEHEADFYNIRDNRLKIYERDNYTCMYCGKQLTRFTVTLDHIVPVSEGGDNSAENLRTACLQCNSRKTSRPLGDFLADNNPT